MRMGWMRVYLKIASVLFASAAALHAWRIAEPEAADPSGSGRHAAFVVINLVVATTLWLCPSRLRLVFGILVVQQLFSHGGMAWHAWVERGAVDAMSLFIVVLMPATWWVLLQQRR